MRLISQDGRVDLPYEQVGVSIDILNELKIIVYSLSSEDCLTFARYSTKERVSMARTLMAHRYSLERQSGKDYFRFPLDDDVEEQYNTIFKKGSKG